MAALYTSDQNILPIRRSLPLYRTGGDGESIFVNLRRKEDSLAEEVAQLDLGELRAHPLLSANAKTSLSLDLPHRPDL